MRKIKDVLRLRYESKLGVRTIAESLNLAHSTVEDYLKRAAKAGVCWPLPESLTEDLLESKLFTKPPSPPSRPLPDCQYVYNELRDYKKLNLTLTQLWIEYKQQHPDGYEYTQFCEYYRRWLGKLNYCMRQEHKGGDKVFVDYADGLNIVDPRTGKLIPTQLFVAVWGASNYTYAEASLTQTLPCWINSHLRALKYFNCVPHALVPDCLKSGVIKPCFYEPGLNATYAEMAEYYHIAILPARPKRPRDKAKVEVGVLVSKRWLLAVLRHRTFYSLKEINSAISELLENLNTRPMRKLKQSRREVFERMDRPNALPLPEQPYEYAEWKKAKVYLDYHIEVDCHYYSVPHALLRQQLDVRLTANTVEILRKNERVVAHVRSYVKHGYTTVKEHMPTSHQKYLEWTPARLMEWAVKIGPAMVETVRKILTSRTHPEQGYRACLGILRRLVQLYGPERAEAAARRAVKFNTCSYRSMCAILSAGLDKLSDPQKEVQQPSLPFHENIRGMEYYN